MTWSPPSPTGPGPFVGETSGASFPTYGDFNPDTDVLVELGPDFVTSAAVGISNTDQAFIVGSTMADSQSFGVVWDSDTGELLATFGPNTIPSGIIGNGQIVWGSIVRDGMEMTNQPAMWMSDDRWMTWYELILDDLLTELAELGVEGAEMVERFSGPFQGGGLGAGNCCFIADVNNRGQIVAQGFRATTGVLSPAPGEVFLLDTLPRGPLTGDVNNDLVVDFIDITPFINAQSAEVNEAAFLLLVPDGCFLCADINMDGAVDFLDTTPFIEALDARAAALPKGPLRRLVSLTYGIRSSRGHGCSRWTITDGFDELIATE